MIHERSEDFQVFWAVNVNAWQPSNQEFAGALAKLSFEEQNSCKQFVNLLDQKSTVVSHLLQRKFGLSFLQGSSPFHVGISRTRRGKPYFSRLPRHLHAPNLNFNVSHEVSALNHVFPIL